MSATYMVSNHLSHLSRFLSSTVTKIFYNSMFLSY